MALTETDSPHCIMAQGSYHFNRLFELTTNKVDLYASADLDIEVSFGEMPTQLMT